MNAELLNKVKHSINLLWKGEKLALKMQPDFGYLLAFSGGKDSQCVLELAKLAGVKFKAEYHVTTNDPADNIRFIREKYPEVIFDVPTKSYFQMIGEHGLPTVMRRWCCREFKETKGKNCVTLTGVRAAESAKRAKYTEFERQARRKTTRGARDLDKMAENQFQCVGGSDKFMLYPILSWTEEDVWAFIEDRGIPRNPCYDRNNRVGCVYCPFTKKKHLLEYIKTHPKQHDAFLHAIRRYMDAQPDKGLLKDEKEYFEWWISKMSVADFMKKKMKSEIKFEDNT